ncbi:MAG: SPOR domain-containing protein [Betaproteobacteria bacterium]|nr:SPOR domain-containing protein [Betaproteobacteria bacterium]
MSKDYKGPARKPAGGKSGAGSLLIGILIGLLLGLGIALAVAWYINKMPTPFVNRAAPPPKGEVQKNTDPAKIDDKAAKAADGKPRFDFYKILPGSEEPVTEQQFKDAQKAPAPAEARESFYLQAGAFQNAPDADNLKARLALIGVAAAVQTTTLPDKGVWHRVRVGPYTAIEDLNRARETLKQNGIETTLIKVRETPAQPGK